MAAGWKTFVRAARDIADALADAKKSAPPAPVNVESQSSSMRAWTEQLISDVDSIQQVRGQDVPLAVKYIKRFAYNVDGMTPVQIDTIEPGVRRLIEQASQVAGVYRGADGKPLQGVDFDTTLEAVQEAAEKVDRKLLRRRGGASAGEDAQLAEIKKMAKDLFENMRTVSRESDDPGIIRVYDRDIADAQELRAELYRIRRASEDVYKTLTSADSMTKGQIIQASNRRLGRAKSNEDLDRRWRSLPDSLRTSIVNDEKAGNVNPIAEKGREVRARFSTPATPPVASAGTTSTPPPAPPAAPVAPTQPSGPGGGASPLAQRPQQPPGRPGRKRPPQPPPPEGPDGGRPRRQLPPPPDFPMG